MMALRASPLFCNSIVHSQAPLLLSCFLCLMLQSLMRSSILYLLHSFLRLVKSRYASGFLPNLESDLPHFKQSSYRTRNNSTVYFLMHLIKLFPYEQSILPLRACVEAWRIIHWVANWKMWRRGNNNTKGKHHTSRQHKPWTAQKPSILIPLLSNASNVSEFTSSSSRW